tara:strand:+ start:23717 stop:24061 length:345 start_codon:yes stop_codon:yes gene_type:complete
MSKNTYDIKSYEDLQAARKNLRISIQEQEQSFKNLPIVKIVDAIKNKESIKSSLFENLSGINFESGEKLISSFLLSNKVTRKYFAGYLVAKEMIPYVFEKIKGIISSKEKSIES